MGKLFLDLEDQSMVAEGSSINLSQRFTESARRIAVPEDATIIDWISRKYELVRLIRQLKFYDWLDATDSELEHQFSINGKPFKMKGFTIKPTDKLGRINEILSSHL